jgi:hydrogenase-4 component B
MSFTSYVWVAHDETKEALRAAETYLAVAVIGGMAMLIGLMILYHEAGTLTIDQLYDACAALDNKAPIIAAGILMLVGFGAKAGMFPLHIWLPKAHPVAPAPASALLSGILTKSGIFGVIAVSCNIFRHDPAWGKLILLLGVITMFWGAFLAIFSVNFKRTLACSSMSQIGFILIGVAMCVLLGEENGLAARGTILHMMNHSLFKLLLFMVAGVIYMNTHKLNLNDLRGWGRDKTLLKLLYLSGALGIGGIPLFSGYISKTLLHESILEYGELLAESGLANGWVTAVEWIFLLTGGMTLAYMTKLFVAVFVDKPAPHKQTAKEKKMAQKGVKKPYMSRLTAVTLSVVAVLLPVFGILPTFTMDKLAGVTTEFFAAEPAGTVHYFSLENLKGALISILIAAVLYLLIRRFLTEVDENGCRVYRDVWPKKLDLEDAGYRPLIQKGILPLLGAVSCVCDGVTDRVTGLLSATVLREKSEDYWFEKGVTVQKIRRKSRTRREQILASSLSFGLLLCAAGLVLTLLYLLFWR